MKKRFFSHPPPPPSLALRFLRVPTPSPRQYLYPAAKPVKYQLKNEIYQFSFTFLFPLHTKMRKGEREIERENLLSSPAAEIAPSSCPLFVFGPSVLPGPYPPGMPYRRVPGQFRDQPLPPI